LRAGKCLIPDRSSCGHYEKNCDILQELLSG
jgi:hypothetical protein